MSVSLWLREGTNMSIEAMKLALEALEAVSMEMTVGERYTNAGQQVLDSIELLRVATTQQLATGEPMAALVRSRRIRTPAHCAFDKKDHYSEWSDWEPCTLSYARAVTDPARDKGLLPLYEMLPLCIPQAPSVPATPEPVKAERDQLRCAQADAVMPLIGPLLDAWENADREVMSQEPELSKQLKNINSAMEDAQPATGEPVWCVATGERVNGEETYTHHDAYVPLADCFPLYTHPAPSVRADVVRVPLQVLKDASEALGNFVSDHGWGDTDMQAMDNLDAYIARHEAIDAAMLAAK